MNTVNALPNFPDEARNRLEQLGFVTDSALSYRVLRSNCCPAPLEPSIMNLQTKTVLLLSLPLTLAITIRSRRSGIL